MNDIIQPLNYATCKILSQSCRANNERIFSSTVLIDLEFNAKQIVGLRKAVSELRESLHFKVYVYDAVEDTLLGTAVVDIWIMVEDGCNIVRQVSSYIRS